LAAGASESSSLGGAVSRIVTTWATTTATIINGMTALGPP
jgi:hypothetical protein